MDNTRRLFVVRTVHTAQTVAYLFLYIYYCAPGGVYDARLIRFVCSLILFQSGWSLWSWYYLTGRFFDPYVLFMMAAYVFNAGHAFLEVFGLNQIGILGGVFSNQTIVETLFLVLLALNVVHLGALLNSVASARDSTGEGSGTRGCAAFYVGAFLFTISAVPMLVFMRELTAVSNIEGYGAIFDRGAATGFDAWPRFLSGFFYPATLYFLFASKQYGKRLLIVSLFAVCASSVALLALGSRWQGAMPLVSYAWFWHRSIRRLPLIPVVTIACFFVFLAFPLISALRGSASGERFSLAAISARLSEMDNPAIASIFEMGRSMNTVAYTLELVPRTKDFEHGESYLYAAFSVLPSLFWPVHPSKDRGSASSWLIETVNPWIASRGGGFGYSFIAEAYLNFGSAGGLLFLAILGFILGRLCVWAEDAEATERKVLIASMLPAIMFYTREETVAVIRYFTWYSVGPYLLFLAWRAFCVNKNAGTICEP